MNMVSFIDGTQPCATTDPEIFFAEEGEFKAVYKYEDQARAVCESCHVSLDCLRYALNNTDLDGIWGGTTPRERIFLRKRLAG